MKPIALALGLPETATEAEILAKITANGEELKALKDKEAGAEADAIMNRYGKRIPDGVKPLWKAKLIANRKETEELMAASFPEDAKREAPARIFNRADAQTPDTVADDSASTAEANKKAAAIRNRATEISARDRVPYNQAFARAQAELS